MLEGGVLYNTVKFTAIISTIMVVTGYIFCYQKKYMTLSMALQETAVLVILFFLVKYTSLYLAFALYFGLWHAARVMFTEYRFLSEARQASLSAGAFIKAFIPFSLLSFAGIGMLLGLAFLLQATISTFLLFLIFISALTMPHALVMHGMYKVLEKTTGIKSVAQV
jgi:Brp/Blh family beta-carotene 15,15'-monooxygenase